MTIVTRLTREQYDAAYNTLVRSALEANAIAEQVPDEFLDEMLLVLQNSSNRVHEVTDPGFDINIARENIEDARTIVKLVIGMRTFLRNAKARADQSTLIIPG